MSGFNVGMPENFEEKTLCCLVLDRSGSMDGDPINQLNEGLISFYEDIESNMKLANGLEVAIISFNDTVEIIQAPDLVHNFQIQPLTASGLTSLNMAMYEAIQLVEQRKDYYKQSHQSYKRPWIICITDGAPTDGDVTDLANQIAKDTQEKKYMFLPIGVNGADMSVLSQIAGYTQNAGQWIQMEPLPLSSAKFSEFFAWLSASMDIINSSSEGDKVNLPSASGWMDGFTI